MVLPPENVDEAVHHGDPGLTALDKTRRLYFRPLRWAHTETDASIIRGELHSPRANDWVSMLGRLNYFGGWYDYDSGFAQVYLRDRRAATGARPHVAGRVPLPVSCEAARVPRQELRWLYDRRNLKEAQQDLQAWLTRWQQRYPKLTDWVEAHIGETLNFYSLPRQHHKHLKSTNMLERLNEEIKRRTRVVRIFPNPASCLRLVRALCAEVHEGWLEDHRYLNMEYLKEQKKELRTAA